MDSKRDNIILFAMTTFLSLGMGLFLWPVVTTAMDQTEWPGRILPEPGKKNIPAPLVPTIAAVIPAKNEKVPSTPAASVGFGPGLTVPKGALPGSPQALTEAKSAAENRARMRAEAQQNEESRELKDEVTRLEAEQAKNQREKKYDSFVPTLDKLARARADLAYKDSDAYLQTLIQRYRSMEPALEPRATIVKSRAVPSVQSREAFSAQVKAPQRDFDTVRGPEEFSPYTTMEPIQ